jgi:hypothetical protein
MRRPQQLIAWMAVAAVVVYAGGPLTFGVPAPFSFPAVAVPTLFNGVESFRVTVPAGATRLTLRLVTTTPNVDVNLYVRFGQDVVLSGGQPVADHRAEGPTGNETLEITTSSSPPLQAGTYFISLRVVSSGVSPQGTLTATVQGGGPILESGTPRSFSFPAAPTPTLFGGLNAFRIDVPAGATSLTVQLATTTPNVNLDLHVRLGEEPVLDAGAIRADHSSTGPTGNESLTVTPSSLPPLRAGSYFIVLRVLTTGVPCAGTVTATVQAAPSDQRVLSSGVGAPFQLGPVTSPTLFFGNLGYRIDVPAGATQMTVQLTTTTPNANVDLFVRFGQEPAVVSGNVVADHKAESPTGTEVLNIFPAGTPPLRTGTYFIALGVITPRVVVEGTVTATIQMGGPAPPVAISTASLPNATVGQNYNQTLAATGGTTPYSWSVESGSLPAGIVLNSSGVLSGIPATAGQSTFVVRVTDSRQTSATRSFTLTVNPATLAITTATLPNGTLGTAYPATTLAASGGTGPYRWSVTAGALPGGLSLNDVTGVVSGTPAAVGSFTFTVTVTDSRNTTANRQYTIQISAPGVTVTATGISGTIAALAQPNITLSLPADFPADIVGTLTMTFTPDAVNAPTGVTDARFSNGQRTVDFTIARGSRSAVVALQTGTVAGQITVSVTRLQSGGANLTPLPAPLTATIARAAPAVTSACMAQSGNGFVVVVRGFATPREVTRANFRFTGAGVTLEGATQVLPDAENLFNTWFRNPQSFAGGGQYRLTVNFAVDDGSFSSIGQGFVTMANNAGAAAERELTRQASCP